MEVGEELPAVGRLRELGVPADVPQRTPPGQLDFELVTVHEAHREGALLLGFAEQPLPEVEPLALAAREAVQVQEAKNRVNAPLQEKFHRGIL